jgi:hypothetical protein
VRVSSTMAGSAARSMDAMRKSPIAVLMLLTCAVSPASADLGMTMTTTVTALSIDSIADDVFALPAGHTKR